MHVKLKQKHIFTSYLDLLSFCLSNYAAEKSDNCGGKWNVK